MSSSTGARFMEGTIVATNAALEIRTPGFTPRKVKVTNATSLASVEWTQSMANASAWKQVAAGTRTLETSDGITPLTGVNPGFQIGAMADINDTTTELLYWEATE